VGVIPLYCVIFRNNLDEKSAKKEVEEILNFLKEIKEKNKIEGYAIKLTYILLNRKSDLKVMLYNNYTKEYETTPSGKTFLKKEQLLAILKFVEKMSFI